MASFDIEQAAFSGFGVLRRSPFSPVVWATLWAVAIGVVLVPFGSDLLGFVVMMINSGGHPDLKKALGAVVGMLGLALLWLPIGFVLGGVVPCAVYRAVLRPEEEGFAYLQLGRSEWIVMLVLFVKNLLIGMARVFLSMVLGVAVVLFSGHGLAARVLAEVVTLIVVLWLSLRLSLAGPMSFRDGRFRLFESWALTRGQDARLFGVALIIGLICVVVYLIAICLGAAAAFAIWGGPPVTSLALLQTQTGPQMMTVLAPLFVLVGLLEYLIAILVTPIVHAPWPRILQRMTEGPEAAPTASA